MCTNGQNSHNTSKKALVVLQPAVLQALQMCNPLSLDATFAYFRSPARSTCTSPPVTILTAIPLPSSSSHVIIGWSGPWARHESVTLLPSSTEALLGGEVKTGKSEIIYFTVRPNSNNYTPVDAKKLRQSGDVRILNIIPDCQLPFQ